MHQELFCYITHNPWNSYKPEHFTNGTKIQSPICYFFVDTVAKKKCLPVIVWQCLLKSTEFYGYRLLSCIQTLSFLLCGLKLTIRIKVIGQPFISDIKVIREDAFSLINRVKLLCRNNIQLFMHIYLQRKLIFQKHGSQIWFHI